MSGDMSLFGSLVVQIVVFFSPGPEVIKLFFMLNTVGHETFSANKYENANNSWHFHI